MTKTRKYVALTFMALGQGAVYYLPYLRAVYYNAMLDTLSVTNAQLGSLVSFFAIGCMVLYIPGGIMSDKWNYKKCIVWSLFSTAALVASFGFFMNFAYARIVYFLLAFTTTFVFWSAQLKAVRAMGDDDNQGKTYGFFYAAQGVLSIVINNIMLVIFNNIADKAAGLRLVIFIIAAVNLVAAVGDLILLPDPSELHAHKDSEDDKFSFKKVGAVVKNPLLWLIAVLVFCSYGFYSNSFYYSTFLVNVRGMSDFWGSQFTLFRSTYMMALAPMIGGFFADKMKSTAKLFVICGLGASIITFIMAALANTGVNIFVLAAMTILPNLLIMMVYFINSSLYHEFRIPLAVTGTAIGFVSILGYTPDLLFGPLLGGWLDKQGEAGYQTIFAFFGILMLVCTIAAFAAVKINKAQQGKQAVEQAAE